MASPKGIRRVNRKDTHRRPINPRQVSRDQGIRRRNRNTRSRDMHRNPVSRNLSLASLASHNLRLASRNLRLVNRRPVSRPAFLGSLSRSPDSPLPLPRRAEAVAPAARRLPSTRTLPQPPQCR